VGKIAKFGDLDLSSRFGIIVRTDTHRQSESQMRMIAILTRLPSVPVIKGTVVNAGVNFRRNCVPTPILQRELSSRCKIGVGTPQSCQINALQ